MVRGRRGRGNARWPWPVLGGAGVVSAVIVAVIGIGQVTGGQACASTVPAAGTTAGTATHYVLSGTGNCSYPAPPADGLFVALSPAEYDGAAACGGYVEVSGPDGSVRAEVIDQCPPCAAGHIDLSEAAFSRIAPLSAGLVSVTYQPVADPPLPAPVALRVKEGSSRYWLALLAMNTGNPLASVQVETAPGRWDDLARADYDYWIASSGAGTGPFTVRLTDTAGHQVTVPGIRLDPGVVQATGTRMYGTGTGAGTAPASATSGPAPARGSPASRSSARRSPAPKPAAADSATAAPVSQAPRQAPVTPAREPRRPAPTPSC
jgi:expansin